MKFYFCLLLLLLVVYIKSKNCIDIKPTIPSDCILSKSDKYVYSYCCYEENNMGKKCHPYTKPGYNATKEMNKEFGGSNDTFKCYYGFSDYIKLGFLLFIVIIIF